MRIHRSLAFLLFLTAGLWFTGGRACVAGEVKFPEKSPLVSFTFPDKWKVESALNKGELPTFVCSANDDVAFMLSLLGEPYDEAAFKQKLPDIARAWLTAHDFTNLEDVRFGKTDNDALGDKMQAVYSDVNLLVDKEPYQMLVIGFTVNGKSMLAICFMAKKYKEYRPDFDKLLASFKPLK